MIWFQVALLAATLVGAFIHEGTHWLVVWLGRGSPEMQFAVIFPNEVTIHNLETVEQGIIRASGIAPLIWFPVVFLSWGLFALVQSPLTFFLALAPSFNILMASESDALAFREPEAFRERALNGEIPRYPLFLPNWLFPDWLPRF